MSLKKLEVSEFCYYRIQGPKVSPTSFPHSQAGFVHMWPQTGLSFDPSKLTQPEQKFPL